MADGSVMGKYFPLNYSSLPKNENLRSNYRLPQQTADIVNVSQILITIKKPKRYVAKQINKKRRQLSSQKQPVPTAKRAWYISAQIEQVPGVGMWHNLVQWCSNLAAKMAEIMQYGPVFRRGQKKRAQNYAELSDISPSCVFRPLDLSPPRLHCTRHKSETRRIT